MVGGSLSELRRRVRSGGRRCPCEGLGLVAVGNKLVGRSLDRGKGGRLELKEMMWMMRDERTGTARAGMPLLLLVEVVVHPY